jgi:hypothetical protein
MLDIGNALDCLKNEVDRLNRAMSVMELFAADRYQNRRNKAMEQAAKFTAANRSRGRKSLIPPAQLDPDATLWR